MSVRADDVDAALACAARAGLLALALAAPDAEVVGRARGAAALLGEASTGEERDLLAEIAAGLGAARPEDLAAEHARLFDCEAPCPPYEGSYEGDPFRQAREMADVAGFYAAFGAEVGGPAGDRPDHVCCELEFLAALALARAQACEEGREEDVLLAREAEDAFLRDHLGRWLGALGDEVAAAAADGTYRAIGRLASLFAAQEAARRGVVPGPRGTRRRWAVEADAMACGAGDASASPA